MKPTPAKPNKIIAHIEGSRLCRRAETLIDHFSGNLLMEVAVPRLELPGPNAVTLI